VFSNLRTEGDRPNHYFVGGLVDPFGWQADLVRVESSDDPELAKLADRELSIPLFELSSYLVRSKAGKENAIDLTYERAGVSVRTADAAADPALQFRSGPLAAKLLAFRPIEADGPVHCRH
jgi:hypothetical protein